MSNKEEAIIECDDNIFSIIASLNKLLELKDIKYKFEIEEEDHDGFEIIILKPI